MRYQKNLQILAKEFSNIPGITARTAGKDPMLMVAKNDTRFFISWKNDAWRIKLPFWGKGTMTPNQLAQQMKALNDLASKTEARMKIYLADGNHGSKLMTCAVYHDKRFLSPKAAITYMTLAARIAEDAIRMILEVD